MDRLMDFIAGYTQIHRLDVSWFGGEPLLGWDRIVALTQRFQALPIRYGGAGILTNGYLLDQEKIARLDELQIVSIQITLDGPAEVHDTRRILAGGGPTFSRIMGNLDTLAASEWKGTLSIRVNIDSTNAEQFAGLRAALLGHFKGMPLMVYPAQVTADPGAGCTADACLDSAAWARYILDLYRQNGIVPYGGFHPQANQSSICVATSLNGFVVGPSGELYKCTEDVGDPGMVVGNVHARPPITNPSLQALYSCGTDAYTDRECLACPTLPICGGGCARRRLHTKHLGIPSPEFCSPHLHSLHAFLEAYIDTVRIRETIAAFLTPDSPVLHEAGTAAIQPPSHSAGWRVTQGWRVLSPQATAPVASVGEPPAC
jgi:uncharacterized protein